MAEMAIEDGITHLVATPHANYRYPFNPEINCRKRDELQAAVGSRLILLLGCDFHLSYENLEAVRQNPGRFCINGLQYLLVEFADMNIPPNMDQVFTDLAGRGLIPIITHPERNPILCDQPEQIRQWIGLGCLVQVTAGAVLGRFGKRTQGSAQTLLRRRMVHFLASDAHNTTTRPPLLSEARRAVEAEFGEPVAAALTEANPRAVIEGRPLPFLPDPAEAPAPKRWFSFRR